MSEISWLTAALEPARSLFGLDVPAHEREHPDVQLFLRLGIRKTILFSVCAGVPTAIVLAFLLWQISSHVGVLVFLAAVIFNAIQHWFSHLRLPAEADWTKGIVSSQITGGAAWGLVPLVAMPEDPQWRGFVLAFVMGVIAANTAFGAKSKSTFYGFAAGIGLFAFIGFLRLGTTFGYLSAALLVYASLFGSMLAAINRAGDTAGSIYAVRSRELAEGLEIERRRLAEQVLLDPLTGLANRLGFGERLAAALENHDSEDNTNGVGLAYLDIDGFKQVNDTLGHSVGDALLVETARRLEEVAAPNETVARLAGDELVVLIPEMGRRSTADEVGARLLRAFEGPFVLDGHQLWVRVSIGISKARPGTSADDLLRWADTALYRAKADGGMRYRVFDAAMLLSLTRRQDLRDSFKDAFERGEIVPWFQPIVDLSTGAIVGAEALMRWVTEGGVRSAHSFLSEVASLGMGAEVDEAMLLTSSNFKRELGARFDRDFFVTVNVSPLHLEMFLERPLAISHLAGIAIELTEESALPDIESQSELMTKIRNNGGSVILDDFGVGFSSFERLSIIPADGIKIDRRFVSGLGESQVDAAIVASLSDICQRMNFSLIAEGIETASQALALQEIGIVHGQGWLYSSAVPADRFIEMLDEDIRLGPESNHEAGLGRLS